MEWQDIISQFEKFLKKKGRSNSTIIAYIQDIKQLSAYSQGQKLNSPKIISKTNLENYIAGLNKQGLFTTKTISRKINSLKTFFKFLLSISYISTNPSLTIRHPQTEPLIPKTITTNEYRALRDCARTNRKIYTMIELLLQTGIRIGELSRLRQRDFTKNSEGKYILHIEKFSTIPSRDIELNHIIVACLQEYQLLVPNIPNNKEGFLFFTKTGRIMLIRNIRTALDRVFQKANIKNATVNDLRNTFIIFQLENCMKIEKLAEIVGHRKITTTKRYLEFANITDKKQITKITAL